MLEPGWNRETCVDVVKLTFAAVLFGSPWMFGFGPPAAWNAWACGYLMLSAALAALTAEAAWEPRFNLAFGGWTVAAPWVLGFHDQPSALSVHSAAGLLICLLSVVELWSTQRNPPSRFEPGAASRQASTDAATFADAGLPHRWATPFTPIMSRTDVPDAERNRLRPRNISARTARGCCHFGSSRAPEQSRDRLKALRRDVAFHRMRSASSMPPRQSEAVRRLDTLRRQSAGVSLP